jgi:glycosyltransferase involved in cell wall biosynthesis
LQRRAIRNADKIGILMGYQVNTYIRKQNLIDKMVKLRLAWDIDKYAVEEDVKLADRYKSYNVVYFMIARHSWKSVWNDMKGNDKFIRSFARFVKERRPNALYVTIEKGNDVGASKQLIEELGIAKNVEWIKEMNKDGIRAYNSLTNVVVVDQFWHDKWFVRYPEDRQKPRIGFGSGSIEALAASRPLITTFFDEDFYDGNHPPILSAFTEDDIFRRLVQSYDMSVEERTAFGKKGYEFVKKYHGWENTSDLYIQTLHKILQEKGFTK